MSEKGNGEKPKSKAGTQVREKETRATSKAQRPSTKKVPINDSGENREAARETETEVDSGDDDELLNIVKLLKASGVSSRSIKDTLNQAKTKTKAAPKGRGKGRGRGTAP